MAKKVSVMADCVMLDVDGVAETATGQPRGTLLLVDDTMPNIAAARSAVGMPSTGTGLKGRKASWIAACGLGNCAAAPQQPLSREGNWMARGAHLHG